MTAAGIATGDAAGTTLHIEKSAGLLRHSTDNVFNSDQRGGRRLPATSVNRITSAVSTGNGSTVTIGRTLGDQASAVAGGTRSHAELIQSAQTPVSVHCASSPRAIIAY